MLGEILDGRAEDSASSFLLLFSWPHGCNTGMFLATMGLLRPVPPPEASGLFFVRLVFCSPSGHGCIWEETGESQ